MSSTELLEAASISMTSIEVAPAMATQDSQAPQGSVVGPRSQLRQAARILAIDVLPVPRDPTKRLAWCTLPCSTALRRVRTTCSWPTTSAKVRGRWRRYSDGADTAARASLRTLPADGPTARSGVDRRAGRRALRRLGTRLRQLRHALCARLGPPDRARAEPELRRLAGPHAAPARQPPRAGHRALDRPRRRGRDRRDRLPRARRVRVADLRARSTLVRRRRGDPRRADLPHPRAGAVLWNPRVRGPVVPGARPRRTARDRAPPRALRPAGARRPGAAGGMAVQRGAAGLAVASRRLVVGPRGARGRRSGAVAGERLGHRRLAVALADRHPRERPHARARDRPSARAGDAA